MREIDMRDRVLRRKISHGVIMIRVTISTVYLLALAAPLIADDHKAKHEHDEKPKASASAPASQPGKDDKPAASATVEKASVTDHEVVVGGETIKYKATAANMLMKDEAGKLKANVFFVAYEKAHAEGAELFDRPVMFVFNGGPGAAAIWLHLGTAGPRRINLLPDGQAPPPPHRLVPNQFSWLDATDLVFIDPVGTGYSRAAEGEKSDQFYGVREDINWMSDFIRLYTTTYQRWLSPKFLAGESYGTTRAAGLSERLLDRYGISLNGVVLISVVLDFQTLRPGGLNDLPYVLYLPSYAAVAWYHKRLGAELQEDLPRTLDEVRAWSLSTYEVALAKGQTLSEKDRRQVIDRLTRYTSLPADLIERANLRIDPGVFEKKLLADQHKIIGRFDGRITGYDPTPIETYPDYDPSFAHYLPVYSATFNDYVRRELKFESPLPYEALSDKVHPWKFGESGQGFLNVADNLSGAMVKNPNLRVMFANGYFDLATPFFATEYTIDHLTIGADLLRHASRTFYHGGHMMYHNRADLEKLHHDIVQFIQSAIPKD
jgi:carboxypeptidase C (cathepsin A)